MFWRMESSWSALRRLVIVLMIASLTACAHLSFKRKTETSGTFTSSGWSTTIFAVDIPKGALQIARENASDSNLANLQVEQVLVVPYLGPLDFLLDIIGFRYARISGTWGFSGN